MYREIADQPAVFIVPDLPAEGARHQLVTEAGTDHAHLPVRRVPDQLGQSRNPCVLVMHTAGAAGYQDRIIILELVGEMVLRYEVAVQTRRRVLRLQQVHELLRIGDTPVVGPETLGHGVEDSDTNGTVHVLQNLPNIN